ncbi:MULTISPECIES: hypothetical protein [unclassified Mycobacterium]|uniref:hypothetical protein n=1 Tax=unclassified Mycobacterium TaxID=2642494 RepID=UPI0004239D1D|nr:MULTISPECIES: hypothetical protein [unclassified Mycobacterium]
MRAEEGDETVKDYAAEGEQTLGRIKDSQRAGSRLGRLFLRITKFVGVNRASSGGRRAG